jgi:hypothetical protein
MNGAKTWAVLWVQVMQITSVPAMLWRECWLFTWLLAEAEACSEKLSPKISSESLTKPAIVAACDWDVCFCLS